MQRPAQRRPCIVPAKARPLLAQPDLRLADEGHAARHLQPAAAVDQRHLRPVDLALVGLEDGAAGVLAATLGLHPADDFHPRDRLAAAARSEEHTSELQSREKLVCRLLLEKKRLFTSGTS